MKKVVVLSGAGISAESGLQTFRDSDGLWNDYRIEDVATYEAWERNQELVMDFYNQRRKQLLDCKPNIAHLALKELEKYFDVSIVTQNVDDLHERAGSSKILHLHGELTKAKSTNDDNLVYEVEGWELKIGDKCEKGYQLRPHVVWFGEAVPAMYDAIKIVEKADILIVVGTSLLVYPAASLINYTHRQCKMYLVDPKGSMLKMPKLEIIQKTATEGIPELVNSLINSEI